MSNNEVVGRIRLELTGDQKVIQQFKATQVEQKNLIKSVNDSRPPAAIATLGKQFAEMGNKVGTVEQRAKDLMDTLETIGASKAEIAANVAEFNRLTTAAQKATEQVKKVAAAEKEVAASGDAVASAAASPTKSGSAKLSASSAVSSVSGVGRGVADLVSGDIVNGVQSIATAGAQAAPALTAMGVSIGTIAAAAGIALPALIAIGLAVKSFVGYIQDGQKGVDAAIANLNAFYAAQTQTSAQIKEQIRLKEQEAKINEVYKAQLEAAVASARSQGVPDAINPAVAKLDELNKGLTTTYNELLGLNNALETTAVQANDAAEALKKAQAEQIKVLDAQAQREIRDASTIRNVREGSTAALKEQIATLGDQINAAQNEILSLSEIDKPTEETKARIEALKQSIRDWAADSLHLGQAILPVVDAREKEIVAAKKQEEALKDAIKAADEYANNTRKIADIEKSRSQTLEDRARADARNAQVSALENQIAAAKAVEAQQAAAQKIVSIREKAAGEEVKAAHKYADDVRKVNREFMDNELKELANYRKEEARATDQYATERRRKLEDLTASLSELASKGDVSGFIRAQRAGTTDLNRGAEDFNTQARQRAEDFADGVRQRQEERDAKLRDLQESFVQERAARQDNLRQQIEAEQEAGKVRITRSMELEAQLQALREQFAIEDQAIARKREDDAFKEQMAALEARQKQLKEQILKVADPAISAAKKLIDTVGASLADSIAKIKTAAGLVRSPRAGGSGAFGAGAGVANAEGGVFTMPTLLKAGEKPGYGDVVIPFRQSEGVLPALDKIMQRYGGNSGGDGGNVTVNLTTGNIATQVDISNLKADVVRAVKMARTRKGA